jgi:acyl-CoA dehydrogenase
VFFLLEAGWGWLLSRRGGADTARAVLPAVCKGEAFLGIATTEPSGGSDLANLKTTATREGEEFVLRGEKSFISGVEEAKALGGGHLTLARDPAGEGFQLLYVPTRSNGISVQRFENMGRMGISTGSLSYESVRVPAANLVGPDGKGFETVVDGFRVARTFVAAACVGAAERALEAGSVYIKERAAFGHPLGKYEGIQFELVDLYVGVEAVKWQCRRAAWLLDQHAMRGGPARHAELDRAVAAVKLTAPPMAFDTVRKVMAWFGAAGYTKDVGLERGLRGIMSYMVGAEGGLNIMRIILGRELLGPEFVPYK